MRCSFRRSWGVVCLRLVVVGSGWLTAAVAAEYELPGPGEQVSLAEIKLICEVFDLPELWESIERDPPARPFKSDGCTAWMDEANGVDLYPACFLRDLKYGAGQPGDTVGRLVADAELLIDVAKRMSSTQMAETMYAGVRVGGSEHLRAEFSWGFGRRTE